MKKRKTNKKLPRYDLGTMKRLPLGYQPSRGIGSTTYSVEQGLSIAPEVQAMRANYIPNTLNQASNNFSPLMTAFSNTKSVLPAMVASFSAPTTSLTAINTLAKTSPLANTLASTTGGNLLSGGGMLSAQSGAAMAGTKLGSSVAEGLGSNVAKEATTKTVATALGNVAAGAGALWGGYNIYNDIANAGSHRTAADMQSTRSKTTVTTDKGNTYDLYGGPDLGAELSYENQARKAKQTSFALNTTSTGASLGFLAGSIIPGLGNLLGSGIGAGIGALVGGLGSLFGFGDNEDEVKEEARRLADATARQNQQSEAVAKSKDMEASAAFGKSAYGKMQGGNGHGNKVELLQGPEGYVYGKALSMVEPGEGMYNTETYEGKMVDGKGSGDIIPSTVSQFDPTIIFSRKLGMAQKAQPLIEEQNRLKDIIANAKGSSKLKQFLTMMAQRAMEKNHQALLALGEEQNIIRDNMLIKKFKNGKCLPGFSLGTIGEYALAALPHIGGLMGNIARYNRAKNADTYAPDIYVEDALGTSAVNDLNNLRYDVNPYLRDAQRALAQLNWLTRRNVGLGLGGRAVAQNANFLSYLNSLANIYNAKNEAENKFIAMRSDAKAKLGAANRQYRTAGLNNQFGWLQQLNAAKEGYLDQITKDAYTISSSGAADVLRMIQYNQAQALENKKLALFDRQLGILELAALNALNKPSATVTTKQSVNPTNAWYGMLKPEYNGLFIPTQGHPAAKSSKSRITNEWNTLANNLTNWYTR